MGKIVQLMMVQAALNYGAHVTQSKILKIYIHPLKVKMYKSYAKYDEEMSKIGLWVLFITLLVIFIWLIYEFYQSFSNEPTYRWELSFNIVGLPFIIFILLLLIFITKGLIKKIFS